MELICIETSAREYGSVELDQLNKGQIVIFIFACLAGSGISGRSRHSWLWLVIQISTRCLFLWLVIAPLICVLLLVVYQLFEYAGG